MLCACGVSISFHHCAGEFKYLSLNDDNHEIKCCKGKKEMPANCCKSNKISFKKTDDNAQTFPTILKNDVSDNVLIAIVPVLVTPVLSFLSTGNASILLKPPDRTGCPPLYILYSVFRI